MTKIFTGIILLYILIINSGCPGKSCIEARYTFAIQSQFTPNKDSIHVGDTLYLTSVTSTKMKDLNSGAEVDYSNAKNLGSDLFVMELPTNDTTIKEAVADFSYVSIKGKIYNDKSIPSPNRVQQLSYEETNGNYELRIGIIPNKKGVYYLGVGNGLSVGRDRDRNCEKASFDITISNTNQHLYYFYNWKPRYQFSDFEGMRAYCFKVN